MSDDENDSRKTVDDILAEYRSDADAMDRGELYQPTTEYVRRLLDRIKAAWKRERAKVEADALAVGGIVEAARTAEKSSAVGNSAAMRETMSLFVHDFASFRKDVEHGIFHMMQCMDFVKKFIPLMESALSAPARNCDRFVDETDAQIAFLNEVWLISVDRETMLARDKYENWSDEMRTRYGKWLLAPAAERKGEDDDA